MTDQSLVRPKEYTLFRQEVLDYQRQQRQFGEIALLQPPSVKILAWLLTVSVVAMALFAATATYARKETVAGYLTPVTGTAKIFVPRAGIIKAIHVREGQQVEPGQELLTISNPLITTDGQDVDGAILESLLIQQRRYVEQIASQQRLAASEAERLAATIKGLESERRHLEEQITVQSDRIKLAKESVTAATQLKAKGNLPEIEFRNRQEAFLGHMQQLSQLRREHATRSNELVEARHALEQLPILIEDKVQVLRTDMAETEQRIAEINGRRGYVIRAPRAGRVSTLQARIGQTATPEQLQLEILPDDSKLQAELFVPTRAIGFVRVGQRTRILYDAFPYQRFGVYGGEIVQVSQAILTGSHATGPVALKEPAYKVTVALDRPDVSAYGQLLSLQADMTLQADIVLDRQSLMMWLLDPLFSARM